MAGFSATDAAFTGFRVVRQHPAIVVAWTVLQFLVTLAVGTTTVRVAGERLALLQSGAADGRMDPAAALAFLHDYWPLYLAAVAVSVIYYGVLYAAVNRSVLEPVRDRFGYLRLGRDELRQAGLVLLAMLMAFLAEIAIALAAIVIELIVALVDRNLAYSGFVLALLAGACALVFCVVRLSLASPLTFATRRINLFGSWALTRGRFWPMFGAYVLALALALVIFMLGEIVVYAASALLGGPGGLAPGAVPTTTLLSPARLVAMALSSLLTALIWPVVLAPPVWIYHRIAAF